MRCLYLYRFSLLGLAITRGVGHKTHRDAAKASDPRLSRLDMVSVRQGQSRVLVPFIFNRIRQLKANRWLTTHDLACRGAAHHTYADAQVETLKQEAPGLQVRREES